MPDIISAQRSALAAWATDAIDAGWLPDNAVQSLNKAITAAPAQLFEPGNRPLVAGLFGGTGVGKSSLLNRFANEPIARASAERPTSRDITVYVHRSVSVNKLPDGFPMHKMRTALHNNEQYRHVMFIDMPDFDSVETANRDLVDLWLPHLDIVLYVVSPERYRDDQGWRLLLKHASQHAWMFIMNHWDRGDPAQLEDFRTQLAEAGLSNPLLFRSDSSTSTTKVEDDFDELQSTLQHSADQSIIAALGELGIVARLKGLKQISDQWLSAFGSNEQLTATNEQWNSHWQASSIKLHDSLQHKLYQHAQKHAEKEGSWLDKFRRSPLPAATGPTPEMLIDDTLLTRLDNDLADFLNQQSQNLQLPITALRQAVAEPYTRARRDFTATVQDGLDRSLALPGSKGQRLLHKLLGALCVLLPLGAMGWIAWRVVNGFAVGGSNPDAYLGSSFAVNAALLLGLAWLLPVFLRRKIRPSREKAALRGLNQGLQTGLANVQRSVASGFQSLQEQAGNLKTNYQSLWTTLATPETDSLPEPVKRMLAAEINNPTQRSLDVRANTHNSTDNAPVS